MTPPRINILTRLSRPELFKRMLASIDYPVNLIVHDDTQPRERLPLDYNLLCNSLKNQVTDGWFFFMDDDDYLRPGALKELDSILTDDTEGLIVQFLRNGKPKPSNLYIKLGIIKRFYIGGGALVLHSRHKNIAFWKQCKAADYLWIADVATQVNLKFAPLVLQITGNNGRHGQ